MVIAAYNAAPTIAQAISSVLGQSRRDLELIVVDDGSTDGTPALVREYAGDPRVRLLRQPNGGPANARNLGIGLARGRYVSFLDSDDLWLPRYLELMVGALESMPDAGFAFTRAWILERAHNRFRRVPWPDRLPALAPGDSEALLRALITHNFVCNSATVRRHVLDRVGGYDPTVARAEDYELWLRIAASGYCARQVSGPLVICSDRGDSLSKDDLAMCAGKKRAYEQLLSRSSVSAQARQLVERRLAQTERSRAVLARERRRTPIYIFRRIGARATRPVRQRLHRGKAPPPEVAAWFPGLGEGRRDGHGAEWVPISRGRRGASDRTADGAG